MYKLHPVKIKKCKIAFAPKRPCGEMTKPELRRKDQNLRRKDRRAAVKRPCGGLTTARLDGPSTDIEETMA